MTKALAAAAVAVTLTMTALGCGGSSGSSSGDDGGHSRTVTKADFGDDWPLTVDHATIACDNGGGGAERLTVTVPDGHTYALNGTALDAGTADLPRRIWLDDPQGYGLKVNIGPLQDAARRLC